MPKIITAQQWRQMAKAELLESIDIALRVLSDQQIDCVDAYKLSSLIENIAPLIRKFFDFKE